MADTARTRSALITLFADNVTGQISAQDLRDFLVTVMEEEFAYIGDFWKRPHPEQITADRSGRGWIDYSCTMCVATSFGMVVQLNPSGVWVTASINGARSDARVLGMALESYAMSAANGQVLREGLIKCGAMSMFLSEGIGRIMYLDSGAAGLSIQLTTGSAGLQSIYVAVGWPETEGSDVTTSLTDVFRFSPGWGVSEDY